MSCNCPVLPTFDELSASELDAVIGTPLRCTSCGHELALTCPKGHVHEAPRVRDPNVPPKVVRSVRHGRENCICGDRWSQHEQRMGYGTGCLKCGQCPEFRAKRRPKKPGTAAQLAARARQLFDPKTCACGRVFTPTGPNTKRCEVCRGVTS